MLFIQVNNIILYVILHNIIIIVSYIFYNVVIFWLEVLLKNCFRPQI